MNVLALAVEINLLDRLHCAYHEDTHEFLEIGFMTLEN